MDFRDKNGKPITLGSKVKWIYLKGWADREVTGEIIKVWLKKSHRWSKKENRIIEEDHYRLTARAMTEKEHIKYVDGKWVGTGTYYSVELTRSPFLSKDGIFRTLEVVEEGEPSKYFMQVK